MSNEFILAIQILRIVLIFVFVFLVLRDINRLGKAVKFFGEWAVKHEARHKDGTLIIKDCTFHNTNDEEDKWWQTSPDEEKGAKTDEDR